MYGPATIGPKALAFAVLVLAQSAEAAVPQCAKQFSFRTNPTLNLANVQRLAGQRLSPETADQSKLVVWSFDGEDHPSYGRWVGLALVYVTRGDLGEQPVGGLLLQAPSTALVNLSAARFTKKADGVTLVLPKTRGCTSYTLHLSNNGTLTANGVLVGTLSE